MKTILNKAIQKGQQSLSEFESKLVISAAGVPVTREGLARSREEAVALAEGMGFPVVMKGCSHRLTHKTELGMVKVNIADAQTAATAYDELVAKGIPMDGVLVQEMVRGSREFVIGLIRDAQFGPCVMFGLGGVFTEALRDVSFRVAPLRELDAEEMIAEIRSIKLLGEFRGSPAVNRSSLVKILVGLGRLGLENEEISEIDINPLIIRGDEPIAVDAMVVLKNRS